MNIQAALCAIYPVTTLARIKPKRRRASKLDAHRNVIEHYLLQRAQSKEKHRFSQRKLLRKLFREQGLSVNQSTLSRFLASHGLSGFFHE